MQEVKAIIADDEEQLRIYLRSKLTGIWPELVICGEAENGRQTLDLVGRHKPDIAFLDIRMPGLSGLEVAGRIAGTCRVVFITAYDRYAVEAFEKEAIDYLLKPVTPERLSATVARLKNQLADSHQPSLDLTEIIDQVVEGVRRKSVPDHLQWIRAQHRDGIRLIPVDEVIYFKAQAKYTTVVTNDRESLIRKPIKELAAELDPNIFWQIHRAVIINVNRIEKVSHSLTGRYALKLKGVAEILVASRTYSHLFKQM